MTYIKEIKLIKDSKGIYSFSLVKKTLDFWIINKYTYDKKGDFKDIITLTYKGDKYGY